MSETRLAHRAFESYDEYVYKQGGKARHRRDFLMDHLEKNAANFAEIFARASKHLQPGSVLCLGARTGAESIGATRAGFADSAGIDLHPVGPSVIQGDWHDIPFPPASFANIYTNSLDHCLDLEKLCAEVTRVLAPAGRFYVMASNRPESTLEDWLKKGGNEALYWTHSDELRDAICACGFAMKNQWYVGKWAHYIFSVSKSR